MNNKIIKIYHILLAKYSYQGWWPLLTIKTNSKSIVNSKQNYPCYHPKDYSYPKNLQQIFEISIGAILTQNTSWTNVEKALVNLHSEKCIDPKKIKECEENKLKELIKPAGFYNQKSERLKLFANWFLENIDRIKNKKIQRNELLSLKGIGKETCDSILLYALKQPIFIIDAYTKRIMSRVGIKFNNYDDLQQIIQTEITKAKNIFDSKNTKNVESNRYYIYQEYHALLVEHAKRFCKKKPTCSNCPLSTMCTSIQ